MSTSNHGDPRDLIPEPDHRTLPQSGFCTEDQLAALLGITRRSLQETVRKCSIPYKRGVGFRLFRIETVVDHLPQLGDDDEATAQTTPKKKGKR